MKAFDLKWPKTTVTLFSDGTRCRIVWRTDQGMGGAINNNDQCKRRIADSLSGAPLLLEALQNAGFGELASEVEALAENISVESPPPTKKATPPRKPPADKKTSRKTPSKKPRKPSEKQVIAQWIGGLDGTDVWANADAQKAMKWHKLLSASSDAVDAHEFHLKTPTKKNPKTWLLRRSWPNAKRGKAKPEFFVAEDFKGVCACMLSFAERAGAQLLSDVFMECTNLAQDHEAVQAAAGSWTVTRGNL